jgi:hypothetical protein
MDTWDHCVDGHTTVGKVAQTRIESTTGVANMLLLFGLPTTNPSAAKSEKQDHNLAGSSL